MLMKKILAAMYVVMALTVMSACGTSKEVDKTENVMVTMQGTEENTEEEMASTQSQEPTDDTTSKEYIADMYVGTYNDYDNNEPNLKISLNEDGTYSVVIGIFRLTSLEDGMGTLTERGLEFTAIDAAGNPIGGVITLEGDEAVVTFTNSTWELIENGTSYRYVKLSDE